jgi:hypothetical protein
MFFDAKMALTVSKTKNSITRQDKIDFFELPQKNKQYNKSQTIKLQDNEQNYRHRDSSFEGRVT